MGKYVYHFQLDKIEETGEKSASLALDFENHDDLFRIIGFMKESGRFPIEEDAVQFAVGLKLFSGVMMKNRDNDLFKEFEPAFIGLMKKLKGH